MIRNSKLLVVPICAFIVVAMAPAQNLDRSGIEEEAQAFAPLRHLPACETMEGF